MVTRKPALQAAEICTLEQVVCSTELDYLLEKVGLIPCEIHMENGIYLTSSMAWHPILQTVRFIFIFYV